MYKIIELEDAEEWQKALDRLGRKDVYYQPEYSRLYEQLGDGTPLLFYYENPDGDNIGYVFLKRPLDSLPIAQNEVFSRKAYDIITPYGYGGPLYNRTTSEAVSNFRKAFGRYCQEENIVSEFIRFNPMLKNHFYLDDWMDVSYNRETIYIDLRQSRQELFSQYHHNHRRNIRKARKYDLSFKAYTKQEAVECAGAFYEIYKETMDRVGAEAYFYFSENYIRQLLEGLDGKSMIGAVFYEGKMVSAALCMHEGDILYYHLGCSKEKYFHLRANVFQFHHIALWAKEQGLKSFFLGGGHSGRDSLFRFKHRFSPKGIADFYLGKKIHQPKKYQLLAEKWQEQYPQESLNGFFPVYRTIVD